MRALRICGGQLELVCDYPEPTIGEGWSRVRVLQAGICETDLQLLQGYMGFEGVLGHEFVGIAEDGPFAGKRVVGEINCACSKCNTCLAGRSNHCPHRTVLGILNHDGAFADSISLPNDNLHVVPDQISNDLATLVEPIAAALQIPEQVAIKSDLTAAVVGDGRLGNLSSQMLHSMDCKTTVIGKHNEKLSRIRRFGIATCLLSQIQSLGQFDIVIDCAGTRSGLETAFHLVRPRGTIIMKTTVSSIYEMDLSPVVIHEITIVGSRCGPFDKAIYALASNKFDLADFVTARFPLEDYQVAFECATKKDTLKVIFDVC